MRQVRFEKRIHNLRNSIWRSWDFPTLSNSDLEDGMGKEMVNKFDARLN